MSAHACDRCWDSPAPDRRPQRGSLPTAVMVDLDLLTRRPDLADLDAVGVVRSLALRSEA